MARGRRSRHILYDQNNARACSNIALEKHNKPSWYEDPDSLFECSWQFDSKAHQNPHSHQNKKCDSQSLLISKFQQSLSHIIYRLFPHPDVRRRSRSYFLPYKKIRCHPLRDDTVEYLSHSCHTNRHPFWREYLAIRYLPIDMVSPTKGHNTP